MNKRERRLAAIVFTDIVGYSAMMQKDEVITTKLRNKHRTEFNKFTNTHNGQVIQYFGDGTLSIYPSATDAVEFAVALQKALKDAQPPVPVRIGIHSGDITFGEEDAFGDGVNVASRIESMCIPGGVFISGKVYDDIKNHARLRATYLGLFQLKNILDPMDIFAISNRGITVPEYEPQKLTPPEKERSKKIKGGRKKGVAGTLGIMLGIFGAHRFYLGQKALGLAFLIPFLLFAFGPFNLDEDYIGIIAIVAFIDAILLMTMPKTKFNQKFNKDLLEEKAKDFQQDTDVSVLNQAEFLQDQFDLYLDRGLEDFQDRAYHEAADNFIKSLHIRYDDSEVHFLLARCYSLLKNVEKGMAHLDAAVAFGIDYDRVERHKDLAYLRLNSGFAAFEKNDFRLPESHIEEFLEEEAATDPTPLPAMDLLEQLQRLKKLRDQGILTEEEFLVQQKRMKLKD